MPVRACVNPIFLFAALLACASAPAAGLKEIAKVELGGELRNNKDVSAVALVGKLLAVVSDEGNLVQFLKPGAKDRAFTLGPAISLGEGELDLEGAAAEGNTLFVIGSHSFARLEVRPTDGYRHNRTLLAMTIPDPARDFLYRLKLDGDKVVETKKLSLRAQIDRDPILRTFREVPSKENGVDIEGIATDGEHLYLGFRGPVIRGNYAPVMKLKFDDPASYSLSLVNLGGRGIRDITRIAGGFLLIGGPVGDGPGDYRLYHWNGRDCVPGEGSPEGKIIDLGQIPTDDKAKPEGVAVISETAAGYVALIAFDGPKDGRLTYFEVAK